MDLIPNDHIDIINYGSVLILVGTTAGFVLGHIDLNAYIAVNAASTAAMAAAMKLTKNKSDGSSPSVSEDETEVVTPKVP